jgi:HD-like signal output (HDOD) protein
MAEVEKSADLSQEQLEKVFKGIKIPPQPQILVDIQMETAMPGCSLDDIAALIAKDVSLSGWVLKTANSSLFGLPDKVTSIGQAIKLLGVGTVINIVNAVSISEALAIDNIDALNDFWDNANDVASASSVVAKKLNLSLSDSAYTLGLFHDCGIPLLRMKHENYFDILKDAYAQDEVRITEVENRAIMTNHAVIGYYVAKSWKLPTDICQAIADHHKVEEILDLNQGAETTKKNLLATLKIAEHLCGTYSSLGEAEVDYEFERIKPKILGYLGISEIELDDIRDDLYDQGILHL